MNELWVPVLVAFMPLAGGGLIAWGALRAEARGLRHDMDEKASQEIVDAHYCEIIKRLDRIEKRVNGEA